MSFNRKEYYQKNKEKYRESSRKWAKANADKIKVANKRKSFRDKEERAMWDSIPSHTQEQILLRYIKELMRE